MNEGVFKALNTLFRGEPTVKTVLEVAKNAEQFSDARSRKLALSIRNLFYVRGVLIRDAEEEARLILEKYQNDKSKPKNQCGTMGEKRPGWATLGNGSIWRRPTRYD